MNWGPRETSHPQELLGSEACWLCLSRRFIVYVNTGNLLPLIIKAAQPEIWAAVTLTVTKFYQRSLESSSRVHSCVGPSRRSRCSGQPWLMSSAACSSSQHRTIVIYLVCCGVSMWTLPWAQGKCTQRNLGRSGHIIMSRVCGQHLVVNINPDINTHHVFFLSHNTVIMSYVISWG